MKMAKQRFFSDDQRADYDRAGFLVVPSLFDNATVGRIAAWVNELAAAPEIPGKCMKYFEDSLLDAGRRVLSRVENYCPYHAGFDALANGALKMRVAELFGEPAVLFKDKVNFKMPGGSGFEAHQDVQAGWETYAGFFITVLVAVDAATIENGCLEIAAGNRRRGRVGELWKPPGDTELGDIAFHPHPAEPGDAIFFDSFVPHRSAPNLTGTPRRVLYMTYNRFAEGDCRMRYYADKRRSYPPDCAREPGKAYVFRV